MRGKTPLFLGLLVCLSLSPALMAAESKTAPAHLTTAQIVERHVAARGGLQAWRAVQTLSVSGKLDAGSGDSEARAARIARGGKGPAGKLRKPDIAGADKGDANQQVQLPFTLEMKRPRKSRLEIEFAGKTAVQVYDGTNGWKVRPYLNRNDVEPFTEDEANSESGMGDMEGPLVDYAAKGSKVELEAVEPVEGRDAYKLKLTTKNGNVQHIWIDAQSSLDVKIDGVPRRMDGLMRNVWIYQRDFRSVKGLMVPYVYETVIEGGTQTHKMTVESVAVNRALDDSRFAKPQVLVAGSPAAAPAAAAPAAVKK